MNDGATIALIIAVLIGINLYFLPSYIAFKRNHHHRLAIILFNLFLGWTALGWIAAIVWSATRVIPPEHTR